MKPSAVLLSAIFLVLTAGAARAQQSTDIAISAFGSITQDVSGNGVHEKGTKSGGGLLSYRHFASEHSGFEVNFGATVNSQKLTATDGSLVNTQSKNYEFSGAYVYRRRYGNVQPFALLGGGFLSFRPTQHAIDAADPDVSAKTRPMGLFGVGADVAVRQHLAIRAQFRGQVVEAPDFFGDNYALHTSAPMMIYQPSIGVVYRF